MFLMTVADFMLLGCEIEKIVFKSKFKLVNISLSTSNFDLIFLTAGSNIEFFYCHVRNF